jgi:peptide deformylase
MAARRILQLGDPLLREISRPVERVEEAEPVLCDLADTLAEFHRTHGFGRGISGIQIGTALRVIYIEVQGVTYRLINPRYLAQSAGKFTLWDDCFSFPDLMVKVERSVEVRIQYEDLGGSTQELAAQGAFSELIQHEMDHLDGILAVDRALDKHSLCTRQEHLRRSGQLA